MFADPYSIGFIKLGGELALTMHEQLETELGRLDTREDNLLDLVASGEMATDKTRKQLKVINQQRKWIQHQLIASRQRLEVGATLLERA